MKYICRNCKGELIEDLPGILFCHDEGCENRMNKADYGYNRTSMPFSSCWDCPSFHDHITRWCEVLNVEISGVWAIDPRCPLPKVPNEKEQEEMKQ